MKTELLGQEKNVVRIKVEFEAEEFMAKLDEVIRDLSKNASIPGFRKGRIPRNILEMRFGKNNLHTEALEKILPTALKQVTDDYDLDMMDTPSLKVDDITEGQPVTCELTIEVRPEVELPELEEIEVERVRQEVKDETLDAMTAEFREQFSELHAMDRPAADGDVVSATFVTHVFDADGNESLPAGESQPSEIDLSAPSVRKEVKDALLGKSKGDEVSAEFTIESDHYDASMAGKKVRYDIKITAVNEKILPEIGPELFRKILADDTEKTEEDFRNELRSRLLERLEAEETSRATDRAITAIVSRSVLEVPESLMERQVAYSKEQDAEDIKRRLNIGMEEYLLRSGMTEEQYHETLMARAEPMLRRTLVMDEIGGKLGVEVQKEDIEAEISRLSAMYGIERAKVRANYYKNEENMSRLSNGLKYDKIAKAVMEHVKVKEVDKLSAEEPAGGGDPQDVQDTQEQHTQNTQNAEGAEW